MKTKDLKAVVKNTAKKTTETAKKSAKHLEENPKTGLYLIGGIFLAAIGFKIYKSINDVGEGISDAIIGDPNSGGGNVDEITVNIPATITETQAQVFASEIISAMDSWGMVNESEYQTIESVLSGRNAKDFQLISNAFGTPRRNPITGEEAFPLMGSQLNLSQWLSIELSTEQKTRLYNVAPLIFSN